MENRHKERLELTDTAQSAIIKLCEGNPGGLSVLARLFKEAPAIDPDANHGNGFMALLMFDSVGIYGSQIWILYKDICGQDLTNVLALLRAWQLGIRKDIMAVKPDEVPGLLAAVKAELPNFAKAA